MTKAKFSPAQHKAALAWINNQKPPKIDMAGVPVIVFKPLRLDRAMLDAIERAQSPYVRTPGDGRGPL